MANDITGGAASKEEWHLTYLTIILHLAACATINNYYKAKCHNALFTAMFNPLHCVTNTRKLLGSLQ